MKKSALAIFIFSLIMPIALADISIQTDQSAYNIKNDIKISASVLQDKNFDGLFKLTISCGNYKLQYFYSTPISLEANFRTALNVELPVTSSMLGNCILAGDLMTNDNLLVEEKESNTFSVTDQLTVLPVKSRITALPDESIQITGIINEAFGNNVLKASTKIALDNSSYTMNAVDGKFNLTLEIPKNIKSGKHAIEISASDSKGNFGSSSIELEITAIPSYIKTELSEGILLPGSKIGITASLYDQADVLINVSLDLELASPKGSNVFRKIVQSNEKIDYEFSQYSEPGIYALASAYKNLLDKASINITTIREVKVKYENETVFVENVGNVPFEDELTFILESELKKYPVIKKIEVGPGKMLSIDLSKEVPLGIYDVKIPAAEGLEPVKEKLSGIFQNLAESTQESLGNLLPKNENVLANNVTIHDNRPVYKKIASGFSYVSGTLVGADGMLSRNPILAPMILVVILLVIIVRYGRKPIMRMIKGKKDEEDKNQ